MPCTLLYTVQVLLMLGLQGVTKKLYTEREREREREREKKMLYNEGQ